MQTNHLVFTKLRSGEQLFVAAFRYLVDVEIYASTQSDKFAEVNVVTFHLVTGEPVMARSFQLSRRRLM